MHQLTALLAGGAMEKHGSHRGRGARYSATKPRRRRAAAELNRNGLLRTPDGQGLQIIVKVRNKTHRVYAVRQSIGNWKPPEQLHGYVGSNNGYLSAQGKLSRRSVVMVTSENPARVAA
jgi:hypothetical protein